MSFININDNNINNDINTVNIFNSIREIAKNIINEKINSVDKFLKKDENNMDTYKWNEHLKIPFGDINQDKLINDNIFVNHDHSYYSDDDNNNKYDDPQKNMEYLLDYAIEILNKYEIGYSDIDEYPENFNNRNSSCLGGDGLTYVIHCYKNNYNFDVNVIDDCDCNPGIVSVRKIHNIKTKEIYDVYCDLGCQNTGENILNDLLILLDCKDYKQYIKIMSDKWTMLAKKLSHTYNIEFYHNIDPKDRLGINSNNINMAIIVKDEIGKSIFYIVPLVYKSKKNRVILIPSFNQHDKHNFLFTDHSNTTDHEYLKNFSIYNDLNVFSDIYAYMYNYDYDVDNSDNFVNIINNYTKYIYKHYGYKHDNDWLNHECIGKMVNEYKKNLNMKCDMYHKCDIYHPDKLDMVIRLWDGELCDILDMVDSCDCDKFPTNCIELNISYDPIVDGNNINTKINIYNPIIYNNTYLETRQFNMIGDHTNTIQYIDTICNIVLMIKSSVKSHFRNNSDLLLINEKYNGVWEYNEEEIE